MRKGSSDRYYSKNRVRKEFQVEQKVILYKSRLKRLIGKLKTGGSSPFIINKVFAGGAIELNNP